MRFVARSLVGTAVLVVLAACGGGGDALELGGGGAHEMLALDAPTRRFEPTVIEVPVLEEVAFTLKNEGDVTHNFSAGFIGVDQDVEAGRTIEVKLPPMEEGTVTFYDKKFQGDGMQGTIKIG
jgi:plastocyanin